MAVLVILRQRRRHWWEVALVAGLVLAAVVIGLQLATGNVLVFHFGGIGGAIAGEESWTAAIARTAPVGIPAGVLAAALYVGAEERRAGGAEWSDIEQRRRQVNSDRAERQVSALVADPSSSVTCSAPPLGVLRGGDLETWAEGPFCVMPPGQFPAMGLVGESGSGKTVTGERLVSVWARSGRKVVFCDFKGSDPELVERIVAAYKAERPNAACALWPAMPLDMWRGSPTEVANRLLQVQDFSESYYESVAETVVRLVMTAPDVDGSGPVVDSESFLRRLDGAFLARAWEGHREATVVADLLGDRKALAGVRLRYEGFFSALAGRLDHGFSFEDSDLAVLTVPTLAQPKDAMAVARMVLADFGAYALSRKPRIGEDVTLIVDEFSAVTSAAPLVIDLAERVRDVGGQVVVSVQSWEGLGADDAERRRMRDALAPGGLIVHRLSDPEEFIKAAGSVRAMEQSWQLEETGPTGLGTVKMGYRYRVDPDEVRQAKTGEAWVITRGRAAHLSILRSRIDEETREHARRLVEYARRQAHEDLAAGAWPQERDWWEWRPARARAPLELSEPDPFDELMPGPTPAALPPVPDPPALPPGPDPRHVLAIRAYVRAGLALEALKIAQAAKGIEDPQRHVERVKQRRAERVAQARRRRRRRS